MILAKLGELDELEANITNIDDKILQNIKNRITDEVELLELMVNKEEKTKNIELEEGIT